MPYKPINYIVEYVVCAALFFLIIMVRYFAARRFPNQKNMLFSIILWVTLIDLITDVLSALIIDNIFLVPPIITYIINTTYYALQSILVLLMMLSTMAMSEFLSREKIRRIIPLMLPGLILNVILLTNPVTKLVYYIDSVRGYIYGPMFYCIYLVCLFYTVVTLYIALKNHKRLKKAEFIIICSFLAVVIAATFIQFIYPRLLITGVAIAVSVMLMYFSIRNPDSVLDTATGTFTYEAMLTFLQDRANAHDEVKLVAVKIYNMSAINELIGVGNGNLLLKQISGFLKDFSNDAWIFRLRGSCFVGITRSDSDYLALCEHIQARIDLPWIVNGTEIIVNSTVFYVDASDLLTGLLSPEETINYLESIIMQKRHFGDNMKSVRVSADLLTTIQRRKTVEIALREAIEKDCWLDIYFQPIWNIKDERYNSAEVLIRFNHPTLGFIPPDEFVPIAESCGLVSAMDELVIRKTCAFIRDNESLRRAGIDSLAVNLSALEFMHRRLPDLIHAITTEYGVDPSLLYFEITETAATESYELLLSCMTELCQRGYKFALDDFGTGYANISQVIQLPFSMVKMDRSMLFGPKALLEDMARMFGRIGRFTVVEGVEIAEQAEFVDYIGVDFVQGYYYAKPMCRDDFIGLIKAMPNK